MPSYDLTPLETQNFYVNIAAEQLSLTALPFNIPINLYSYPAPPVHMQQQQLQWSYPVQMQQQMPCPLSVQAPRPRTDEQSFVLYFAQRDTLSTFLPYYILPFVCTDQQRSSIGQYEDENLLQISVNQYMLTRLFNLCWHCSLVNLDSESTLQHHIKVYRCSPVFSTLLDVHPGRRPRGNKIFSSNQG
jgi:hypothetical protein